MRATNLSRFSRIILSTKLWPLNDVQYFPIMSDPRLQVQSSQFSRVSSYMYRKEVAFFDNRIGEGQQVGGRPSIKQVVQQLSSPLISILEVRLKNNLCFGHEVQPRDFVFHKWNEQLQKRGARSIYRCDR